VGQLADRQSQPAACVARAHGPSDRSGTLVAITLDATLGGVVFDILGAVPELLGSAVILALATMLVVVAGTMLTWNLRTVPAERRGEPVAHARTVHKTQYRSLGDPCALPQTGFLFILA
jgi:hypothetical protein